MNKSNNVPVIDDNISKTAICEDVVLLAPPLTHASDETCDSITDTATPSVIALSNTTNKSVSQSVITQNEKEDDCLRSYDCDSLLPCHVVGSIHTTQHQLDKGIGSIHATQHQLDKGIGIGSIHTTQHQLDKGIGSIHTTQHQLDKGTLAADTTSDSSEQDAFFNTKQSFCKSVTTTGVHRGSQSPSCNLISPPFILVDTAVDSISDQIGLQLSMLCSASAHAALSNDESNHDGHTVLLSSSSSTSVEHVHESPLYTDSFSDEMICRLPVAAMDNGYCSDEICYSIFSDCVDQVDVLSSDVEATLVACESEQIGSSSSTLRAIRQPLLPLDNSQIGDSGSLKNESPSRVVISEPKLKDSCLVSQWLSSISDCPDDVPSISEYCAATSDVDDVGQKSSSSEQLNSSVSANAILLSLGNTLRDMQIKLSYCDTDLTGIALCMDDDDKFKQFRDEPINPANEVTQMDEPVLECKSNLSSETNSASQSLSLSDRKADLAPLQNLSIRESSCALYETATEEMFVVQDKSETEHEVREQQDNSHAQNEPDKKTHDEDAVQQISNAFEVVSEKDIVKSGASTSQKPQIPESRISSSDIKISATDNEVAPAEATVQPLLSLDHSIKRIYRVGLNIFNIKSDVGIEYMIDKKFVDPQPDAIAKFLLKRKGLSRKAIGEYLSNKRILNNAQILRCFSGSIDLSSMRIDNALRKFLSYFLPPGESQKIEQLMEVFARRYSECNVELVKQFKGGCETVFLLSFAIVLLNTDLHNRCVKPNSKMSVDDFIRNLKGIDNGSNIRERLLEDIYECIKENEFQPDTDHMSRVLKLDSMLLSNPKMVLALPHRRLVSYCQVTEVQDPRKKQRAGSKRRDLFLFNDLLLVTKYVLRKKQPAAYSFRQAIPLSGLSVYHFDTSFYPYGFRLYSSHDFDILLTACTSTDYDRTKLISDLHESVLEWAETQSSLRRFEQKPNVKSFNISRNNNSQADPVSPSTKCLDRKHKSTSMVETAANFSMGSRQSLDSGLISSRSESTGSCQDDGHEKAGHPSFP